MFIAFTLLCFSAGALAHDCHRNDMLAYVLEGNIPQLQTCVEYVEDKKMELSNDYLVAAACTGQYDVVGYLMGANASMSRNRREVQCAAGAGFISVVGLLIEENKSNLTQALLLAAANGHVKIAELLMKNGADPRTTVYCYTPIEWAPEGMYDNMEGRLMTCRELAFVMQEEYDALLDLPIHPPMGLLMEDAIEKETS